MNPQAPQESEPFRALLANAKACSPLPQLLVKIGDGEHAKKSARCPFHEDRHNSFSIFQDAGGLWFWKCHAGCGHGDEVDYLKKRLSLSTRDAIAHYCDLAGVNGAPAAKSRQAFNWQRCVDAFTTDAAREFANWRGLSPEFVTWLHCKGIAGLHKKQFAFAVHGERGAVLGCHYRKPDGSWRYWPKGTKTRPLIFGDPRGATSVLCFESQFDGFAVMDKCGWHVGDRLPDTAVFITRGSENGKLLVGQCAPDSVLYAFVQNDVPKPDGSIPGEKWLLDVAENAGCRVLRVTTPPPHKDANDWTRAGAGKGEIESAMREATPVNMPKGQRGDVADADAELVQKFGRPVFMRPDGRITGLNERFFAARFHRESQILFEPDERTFYQYDRRTGVWRRESDDRIREAVSVSVCDYGRDADLAIDGKISVARMNGILSALRGIAERRDAFRRPRDFVHVSNGVVRFPDDGRVLLTAFAPDDLSRNHSPVEFHKDADCPTFVNELLHSALPDEDVDLLQRCAGLAVAGINPAQRIIILDGGAATGKTTYARIIQLLVGAENTAQLRTALLFERFEQFRFIGKTLLLAPDVPGDFLNRPSAAVLKSLVGGDPLTAEAKGSNAVFALAGHFNILITANARLRVRLDGDAGAWRRRITIIRFENPPPARRIPNFADKLVATEGPGILRWALAGLLKAREEIAATGDLALTRDQQGRVDALLSESDSIRLFIKESTRRGEGNVTSHELVEGYFRFCAANEWTPQPARIVERTLADAILETHGASRAQDITRNGKSVRGWRNVRLLERTATPELVGHE